MSEVSRGRNAPAGARVTSGYEDIDKQTVTKSKKEGAAKLASQTARSQDRKLDGAMGKHMLPPSGTIKKGKSEFKSLKKRKVEKKEKVEKVEEDKKKPIKPAKNLGQLKQKEEFSNAVKSSIKKGSHKLNDALLDDVLERVFILKERGQQLTPDNLLKIIKGKQPFLDPGKKDLSPRDVDIVLKFIVDLTDDRKDLNFGDLAEVALEARKENFKGLGEQLIRASEKFEKRAEEAGTAEITDRQKAGYEEMQDKCRNISTRVEVWNDVFNMFNKCDSLEEVNTMYRSFIRQVGMDVRGEASAVEADRRREGAMSSDAETIARALKLNRVGFSVVMTQVKALQGTHGVFKQFIQEIKTFVKQTEELQKEYPDQKRDLMIPKELNVLNLARKFQSFISTSHPYPHHLLDIVKELGLEDKIYMKVNILERFLHATDKIDPNFFQNPEHKQEVKQVIMQTLEDLYDEIEDLEEEEELEGMDGLLLKDEE